MLVDAVAPKKMQIHLHALYLELMADQNFKWEMSRCYVDVYRGTSHRYMRGIGSVDHALYTLSVQFLNREKFVAMLSEEHSLLNVLAKTISETLAAACKRRVPLVEKLRFLAKRQSILELIRNEEDSLSDLEYEEDCELDDGVFDELQENAADELGNCPLTVTQETSTLYATLSSGHPLLLHRRYSPVISDLKCVLSVGSFARQFCKFLRHKWGVYSCFHCISFIWAKSFLTTCINMLVQHRY
jgi:hypothetical protein